MSIDTKKFVRKPFSVEAVLVTEENMADVARWCRGQLRKSGSMDGQNIKPYIKVNVKRPLNDRQTQAYAGDWVVTSNNENIRGFKVYTPRAFAKSFDEVVDDMFDTLERMGDRAEEEERAEEEGIFPEELQLANKQQ